MLEESAALRTLLLAAQAVSTATATPAGAGAAAGRESSLGFCGAVPKYAALRKGNFPQPGRTPEFD